MLKDFTSTFHCTSRAHCRACRTNPAWRKSIGAPDVCPHATAVPVAPTSCIHRGEEIRRVPCQTCKGNIMAKVFACQIHGECTIFAKPIEGIRPCTGCPQSDPAVAFGAGLLRPYNRPI